MRISPEDRPQLSERGGRSSEERRSRRAGKHRWRWRLARWGLLLSLWGVIAAAGIVAWVALTLPPTSDLSMA